MIKYKAKQCAIANYIVYLYSNYCDQIKLGSFSFHVHGESFSLSCILKYEQHTNLKAGYSQNEKKTLPWKMLWVPIQHFHCPPIINSSIFLAYRHGKPVRCNTVAQ